MLTAQQNEILLTYANLMAEVKSRLAWVAYVANGQSGLDPVIGRETCLLQVRLICELIALCCLAAHGDIEETKEPKYQKQWSAPDLLKSLEALHPEFYPMPQSPPQSTGLHSWHFADFEDPYLTKEKLVAFYWQCGDALHRGSLKNILNGKKTLATEMKDVVDAHAAIFALINVHRIALSKGNGQLCCLMDGGDGNVKTLLAFPAEASKDLS